MTLQMILHSGSKVLIAHRRLFPGDHGRYFVGVVEAYEHGLARIGGHSWLRDSYDGTFHRKLDLRTKIVPLSSGSLFIYQLPDGVDLDTFRIEGEGKQVTACDDRGFEMDLTESAMHGAGEDRSRGDRVA